MNHVNVEMSLGSWMFDGKELTAERTVVVIRLERGDVSMQVAQGSLLDGRLRV